MERGRGGADRGREREGERETREDYGMEKRKGLRERGHGERKRGEED